MWWRASWGRWQWSEWEPKYICGWSPDQFALSLIFSHCFYFFPSHFYSSHFPVRRVGSSFSNWHKLLVEGSFIEHLLATFISKYLTLRFLSWELGLLLFPFLDSEEYQTDYSNKRCLKLSTASSWPLETDTIKVRLVLLSWLGGRDFNCSRGTRYEAVCEPGGMVVDWLCFGPASTTPRALKDEKEGSSSLSLWISSLWLSAHQVLPACSLVPGSTSSQGDRFSVWWFMASCWGCFQLKAENLADL